MKKRNNNQRKEYLYQQIYCLLFSMVPVLCFYLLESIDRNPFVQMPLIAHIMNIALYELFAWILLFLLNSCRWALRVEVVTTVALGIINHYVTLFRSTPLVPWDFYSIRTAIHVAGRFDYTPTLRMSLIAISFVCLFISVRWIRYTVNTKKSFRLLKGALLSGVLIFLCARIQTMHFWGADQLCPFLFYPNQMVKENGYLLTFVVDLQYVCVHKPIGYQKELTEEIYQKYEVQSAEEADSIINNEDFPNIVVIMDEAFSDLGILGDFTTNEDYMPFFHKMQQGAENTITGMLQVNVCGGSTANTEFEFLTGHTMEFLPEGSIPYQQYLRTEGVNLVNWLNILQYKTYAQHPYYSDGWERNRVYPLLGFSDQSFIEDYRDAETVREYVSDAADFEKIMRTLIDKPLHEKAFIFNVTMQNHAPYYVTYNDFENIISIEEFEDPIIEQYLSLIKLTDQSLESFIHTLEKYNEKVVVLFFGDHQPSYYSTANIYSGNPEGYSELTEEQMGKFFLVPYMIWANFDISEGSQENTTASFLSTHLMKASGLPLSPYQKFLLMQEEQGKDADQNLYRNMQYYLMFDR